MIDVRVLGVGDGVATKSNTTTTPSVTPAPNSLVIGMVAGNCEAGWGNGTATAPTDTASGVWTQRAFNSAIASTYTGRVTGSGCWSRPVGASPAAMTVTGGLWQSGGAVNLVAALQVTGHNPTAGQEIRQVKAVTTAIANTDWLDSAAAVITLDQQPLAGSALVLAVFPAVDYANAGGASTRIGDAWAGPRKEMRRLWSTGAPFHSWQTAAVYSHACDGTESTTLYVAGLGKQISSWSVIALEIAADGTQGPAAASLWRGGPRQVSQVWDGASFNGAPERTSAENLVFADDFSTGDLTHWGNVQVSPGGVDYNGPGSGWATSYAASIVADGDRTALRIEVRPGDDPLNLGTYRAEIAEPGGLYDNRVGEGATTVVAFDFRVDSTFPAVLTTADGWTNVHQWHHSGATGSPPTSLMLDTVGALRFSSPDNHVTLPFAPVEWFRGASGWHRITYKIRTSMTVGTLQAWLDGIELFAETPFPTMISGSPTNYLKFGIYEGGSATTTKIAYYARVRVTAPTDQAAPIGATVPEYSSGLAPVPGAGSVLVADTMSPRRPLAGVDALGLVQPLQPGMALARGAGLWSPPGNATTVPGVLGMAALTAVGTATARTLAVTTTATRQKRLGYVSAGTAGSLAGAYQGAAQFTCGSGSLDGSGVLLVERWVESDAATVAGKRAFAGVTSSTAAPTNVDPATLTNAVGVAQLSTDATQRYWIGAGSTAQAAVAVGTSVGAPGGASTTLWELAIWCPPTRANVYIVQLRNLTTGARATRVFTGAAALVPQSSTLLAWRHWVTNNTTAAATAVDLVSLSLEPGSMWL